MTSTRPEPARGTPPARSGAFRQATPLVLLVAGFAMLFEPWVEGLLPFRESLLKHLGPHYVLRGAGALVVFYVLLLWAECERLHASLLNLTKPLRDLYALRTAGDAKAGTKDAPKDPHRLDALRLLVAALQSGDPKVRATSRENLVRLAGQDLGDEPGRWQEWLREQERSQSS